MADKTGDNLDVVVNIVAKADKQAAVQETTKVMETVVKQFDTLSRKDIGKKLIRTFTSKGNVSKTLFNTLFRDLKTGQYFVQARKKGWAEVTDANGKKRRKERFYTFGALRRISQEEAWNIGGIDPSVIYSQIEEAKQEEEAKRIAKERAKIAQEKQEKEKKAAEEQARIEKQIQKEKDKQQKEEERRKASERKKIEKQMKADDKERKLRYSQEMKANEKKRRFLETFKRIGFYRIARGIFAGIKNIFVQGIQGLAEFDKGTNQTVSELLTGYEKLKASVAITIMPLLEAVAPAITSITESISKFANDISLANAASKGLTEYTAISDKYIKDMAKNSQKLLTSFDKFDSLNAKDSPYETRKITEEEKLKAENFDAKVFLDIMKAVGEAIHDVFTWLSDTWKKLKETFGGTVGALNALLIGFASIKITIGLLSMIDAVAKIFGILSKIKLIIPIIVGYLSFKIFDKLFDNLTKTQKTIATVLGSIVALGTAIWAVKAAMSEHWVSAIVGASVFATSVGMIVTAAKAKTYANGGVPDKGSLFIAGESGAELVTTMSGGRTGVSNTEQLREAVYGALSDWWSTAQYDIPEQQATYIDTAEIARSKRFKSELNRTNPNLNLV